MRTFIIRARKGPTSAKALRSGDKDHIEIIAHTIINAFFVSQGFRKDVVVYLILDSAKDFPRTLRLAAHEGLSFTGFHEEAILSLVEEALMKSVHLKKDERFEIKPGLSIFGFGFERLITHLIKEDHKIYLLEPKGESIKETQFDDNTTFILSDHIALPTKSVKGLKRQGVQGLSLGKKMLFASQCITILHYELDNTMSCSHSS